MNPFSFYPIKPRYSNSVMSQRRPHRSITSGYFTWELALSYQRADKEQYAVEDKTKFNRHSAAYRRRLSLTNLGDGGMWED
jgi:hypothetical protein